MTDALEKKISITGQDHVLPTLASLTEIELMKKSSNDPEWNERLTQYANQYQKYMVPAAKLLEDNPMLRLQVFGVKDINLEMVKNLAEQLKKHTDTLGLQNALDKSANGILNAKNKELDKTYSAIGRARAAGN